MNNWEKIKTFNIKDANILFEQLRTHKCLFCKHHYEEGDCYFEDCRQGLQEWLSQEEDSIFWENMERTIEYVKEY